MATKTLLGRIKLKKDTAANWTTNNPVLLDGEVIIVETSSGEERFKIGDGTSTYKQLPFEDEAIRNLIATMMPKAGGTFTGNVDGTATQATGTGMFRNIFIVNGTPSNTMGENGDVCFSI